jgi:ankyrin repeat protein
MNFFFKKNPERTLLYIAAGNNNIDICKHLIEFKADLNLKSMNGQSALHRATYWGFTPIIKLLVR